MHPGGRCISCAPLDNDEDEEEGDGDDNDNDEYTNLCLYLLCFLLFLFIYSSLSIFLLLPSLYPASRPQNNTGKIECLERLIRALASEEAIQGLYKGHPKQGDDVSHIQGGSGFLTAILSLGYGEEKEKGRATFMGVYRERQSTTGVDNPRYR